MTHQASATVRTVALSTLLAASILGCALPPPAEERPLTGALQPTYQIPARAEIDVVERGGGRAPAGVAADAAPTVEVQESPTQPIGRVDDPLATVDPKALERDVDVGPLLQGEDSIVAADVDTTVSQEDVPAGEDSADVSTPMFEERVLNLGEGLDMAYRIGGAGQQPIVLIHGWCGEAGQWEEQMKALAPRYRVVAMDLPGHGKSAGAVRERWTIADYGADVARLLEAEDLKDAVLVGHAMGGQVALEAGVHGAERVAGVVGVDSLHRLQGSTNADRIKPFIERFRKEYRASMADFIGAAIHAEAPEVLRAAILEDAMECPQAVAIALMEHFGVHDPKPAARTIACTVVCINSGTAPTDVEGNRALLTGFDAAIMDGVGHWPHLEAPARFQTQLLELIDRLRPAPIVDTVPTLQSLSPVLYCDNVAQVAEFYVARLGFDEIRRTPGNGADAPDFIALTRDGAMVMVQARATLDSDLPGLPEQPRTSVLFLRVADLDAERVRLGDAVEYVVPERTLDSGSRQLVVRDPAGNVVVVQQGPGASGAGEAGK